MEKISIIVPVFRVEKYLNRCVDSILAQSYKNLEIILVDDGSDDACPLICDEYMKKDNRVKVVHKNNGGLSSARNAGLAIATGDFIGFVDSDDWIHPDMYAILHKTLVENKDCQIAECKYQIVAKIAQNVMSDGYSVTKWNKKIMMENFFRVNGEYYNPVVCTKLIRKGILSGFCFLDTVNEDWEATYEWYKRSSCIAFIDLQLYYYFFNGNGIVNSKFKVSRLGYLEVWDRLVEKAKQDFPEYYYAAVICRTRADFTLLSQFVLNGPENNDTVYKNIYLSLQKNVKNNFFVLLKKLTPFSRKMLLVMLVGCPWLVSLIGKIRRNM